ncbi:hypothetical protein GRI89_02850 [Altererythrobacter salegens]|uniref:Uncharacterized protein n=1 Tax=Croceibacterium salegens TaxID=1737568 RepID=A0A6I4SUJ0_9SPHN|nr:hypothetical protein [Croceibacterium salegens]MXO58486.1 hypothetical protein [Croceibacterium salegens]
MALLLGGCATTRPDAPVARTDATSIQYELPETHAQVALELVLKKCDGGIEAAPTLTLSPVAAPTPYDQHRFRIYGADLASFTKNRSLKIELHPNRAIKSINGGVADRTGAIITGALKVIAGLVPFDASTLPVAGSSCNPATRDALARIDILDKRIKALRATLDTIDPIRAEQTRLGIDALALEVARLKTGQLTLGLTTEISFMKGIDGGLISWRKDQLSKWFDNVADNPTTFALGYCLETTASARKNGGASCLTSQANTGNTSLGQIDMAKYVPPLPGCLSETSKCAQTIVFREPVDMVLTVIAITKDFGAAREEKTLKQLTLPVAQWGDITQLELTAGFAETKTMALGLDEFGRRGSFEWKSDARGEAIVGAAGSIVDASAALRKTIDTQEQQAQQAAITSLETEQKYNKLKLCEEIIRAGGFKCPES